MDGWIEPKVRNNRTHTLLPYLILSPLPFPYPLPLPPQPIDYHVLQALALRLHYSATLCCTGVPL